MPDGQKSCPLCEVVARRHMKAHLDRNADVFDCEGCGIFEIGRSTQKALHRARGRGTFRDHSRDIRSANERGFLYGYPGGELIRDHPWVVNQRGDTASGHE